VTVHPDARRTARVGGRRRCRSWSGTQAHTLATTDGTVSHAGGGGLTLGDGFGWLSAFRRQGAKIC